MRVRVITYISGTRNGVEWPTPGGYMELPDGEAREMITGKKVIEAPEERKVEKADKPAHDVETRERKTEPVKAVEPKPEPARAADPVKVEPVKAVEPEPAPKTTTRRTK